MPTITFNLSAPHLTRVVNALAERYDYKATIDGQPNPQTRAEFVRQRIARWIREEVREHELATARAAVVAGTDVDLT